MIKRLIQKIPCFSFNSQLTLNHLRAFRHAFATPLTTLLFTLDLSDELDKLDKKELKEQLSAAYLATLRLKELLEASVVEELEKLEKERFQVVPAIKGISSFFFSKQLKLVVDDKLNEPAFLFGHKLYFQEALINLVKNAFEAYPTDHAGPVIVSVYKVGGNLEINIMDFAPVKKGHVPIKPFGGLGVGLPFARQVIEEMFSGKLVFERFKTKGARVNLVLPLAKSKKPFLW